MADSQTPGFARLVPGFDFLQNLAKGATQAIPQMPNLSNWVAPTLNVEELEKRITDLKAVHFWLEQNASALGATIRALEVQKMTLATLQGMNFSMGDVADALKLKPTDAVAAGVQKVTETTSEAVSAASDAARSAQGKAAAGKPAGGLVDPLQWWGALTQQFQQIATDAMTDVARHTAVDAARDMATGMAKDAMKSASGRVRAGSKRAATPKKAARKTAAKRPASRKNKSG